MGLIAVAGAILLGGLTMLCWWFTANAWLDNSPATFRPVMITGMVQVTHNLILREYKVEYHFLGGDTKKRDYLSTPSEMARLTGNIAVAEVHSGRLGWPWVKAILPVMPDTPPKPAGAL
jgi:hypothetical protein